MLDGNRPPWPRQTRGRAQGASRAERNIHRSISSAMNKQIARQLITTLSAVPPPRNLDKLIPFSARSSFVL